VHLSLSKILKAYTSGFGYRRSPTDASGWEFHRGLDIAGPEGSYIRNWWAGYVVEVSDHTACGTLIKIQSGNGSTSTVT
jgi:murein DD-endopeptidase MepM/ murein hydrolase activator NlpD